MVKILICCLGGFSSSAMSVKMSNEIKEKGYEDKISIDFQPFALSHDVMNQYDVVMCCPHLKFEISTFMKKYGDIETPIYLLPPKMYGSMNVEDVYEDALDIVEGFKETKMNPFHFPNEDNVMRIKRICSYRKSVQ
ncbi:MAG: PTS sugar transporter subunit IIB [Beduini sp.]|uniref:PTS sugar transporter subunit IIB n=1 Tax=Beduini sp. TaxID=1922300 RepID=UPI0011C7D843